jgi:hypothetical protein
MITPVTHDRVGQAISGMVRTSLLGSPGARLVEGPAGRG